MVLELTKGEKVNLHKENPNLTVGHCGLGWDISQTPGQEFDLDLFMIELGADGKALNESSLIFYKHKENANKSVYVGDDNRTGAGDGFDEEGFVKFPEVPANVNAVIAAVSIYDYAARRQNFGQVNNAVCEILDGATNAKLARYDLTEDMSNATGVVVGRFMREAAGGWSFKAVGETVTDGMIGILRKYGINV